MLNVKIPESISPIASKFETNSNIVDHSHNKKVSIGVKKYRHDEWEEELRVPITEDALVVTISRAEERPTITRINSAKIWRSGLSNELEEDGFDFDISCGVGRPTDVMSAESSEAGKKGNTNGQRPSNALLPISRLIRLLPTYIWPCIILFDVLRLP